MSMLQVELVTPTAKVLSTEADEVTLTGSLGQMGILPGHIALVTGLEPGQLIIRTGTENHIFVVAGGVAQIDQDRVVILAEAAESRDAIDVERATHALAEAQKQLLEKSTFDEGYSAVEASVARAAARIEVARSRV